MHRTLFKKHRLEEKTFYYYYFFLKHPLEGKALLASIVPCVLPGAEPRRTPIHPTRARASTGEICRSGEGCLGWQSGFCFSVWIFLKFFLSLVFFVSCFFVGLVLFFFEHFVVLFCWRVGDFLVFRFCIFSLFIVFFFFFKVFLGACRSL